MWNYSFFNLVCKSCYYRYNRYRIIHNNWYKALHRCGDSINSQGNTKLLYCDNWNQESNTQLTGININQKYQYSRKTNFQEVNRLFVSSFETITNGTPHRGYYFRKVEINKVPGLTFGKKVNNLISNREALN